MRTLHSCLPLQSQAWCCFLWLDLCLRFNQHYFHITFIPRVTQTFVWYLWSYTLDTVNCAMFNGLFIPFRWYTLLKNWLTFKAGKSNQINQIEPFNILFNILSKIIGTRKNCTKKKLELVLVPKKIDIEGNWNKRKTLINKLLPRENFNIIYTFYFDKNIIFFISWRHL